MWKRHVVRRVKRIESQEAHHLKKQQMKEIYRFIIDAFSFRKKYLSSTFVYQCYTLAFFEAHEASISTLDSIFDDWIQNWI